MTGKNISKLFSFFCLISITIFLSHSLFTKTSVFADAKFYYSFTRSLVFDHDLLLGNEFFALGLLKVIPESLFIPSFYPPGVSILWIPLYSLAYGALNLYRIFIPNLQFSGYEAFFEYSCGITSILLGVFALYLVFKMLSKHFSNDVSLLATSTLFLATNLFFYIAVEPINSHAASFFVSTLFIFLFFTRKKDGFYYFLLGIIGGFAGVVRTQDLLILILPLLYIISHYWESFRTLSSYNLLLIAGTLLGFFPQILLWKYFYNTFWYSPYIDVGFKFLNPQIFHVLFNAQNGLLTTTPVIAVAFLGLIFKIMQSSKNKTGEIYIYALIYFLLQLYLISSWNVYSQGGSYSIRMIVTTYPLLAFGLTYMTERSVAKFGKKATLVLIILISFINFLSILNYLLKY